MAYSKNSRHSNSVKITKMLIGDAFASGKSEKNFSPPAQRPGKVKSFGCDCKDYVYVV